MRHLPLQAPLLWQTYLAFWIAGILAAPWPFPATTCALLLLWVDDRLWRYSRLVLAVLCLLGGLMTAQWQLYGAPLRTTPAPIDEQEWIGIRRYCGIVRNTRGLPGNRLRILLENMHQATRQDDTSTSDNPPLSGLVQWTWESPAYESPLPGQTVCLSRRIIPAQGFANQKLPDWGISQAAQGVRWRVWSKGDSGQPRVHGEGTHLARWREALRQGLLRTLLPTKAQNKNIPADSMPIMTSATDLPQGKAILLALLFGDRRYVEQKTLDNFAAATLAHSLALSGQHLAVAGLAGLLCILFDHCTSEPPILSATSPPHLDASGKPASGISLPLARQCTCLSATSNWHAGSADIVCTLGQAPHHTGCTMYRPSGHKYCSPFSRVGYRSAALCTLCNSYRPRPALATLP